MDDGGPDGIRRGIRDGAVVLLAVVLLGAALVAGTARRGAPDLDATHAVATTDDAASFAVWDTNDDGTPVRWDPCTAIELVLSPRDAPVGARRDLEQAVERLRDATGLEIVVAGTTAERPRADRTAHAVGPDGVRWAPVLVAWAGPGEGGLPLRDVDRGVAIPLAVGVDGSRVYVSGQVVLNAQREDLVSGYDDRSTGWGATLVHELAHLLGLDHVDDPRELLWVHPGSGPVAFGPGDLAGLRAVGADGGCLDVPAARPVGTRSGG